MLAFILVSLSQRRSNVSCRWDCVRLTRLLTVTSRIHGGFPPVPAHVQILFMLPTRNTILLLVVVLCKQSCETSETFFSELCVRSALLHPVPQNNIYDPTLDVGNTRLQEVRLV